MHKGVTRTACQDILEFNDGTFDTLLLLMHGIGMVETITGLNRFLQYAHSLIKPNGALIFDSLDVRRTDDPVNLAYQESNKLKNGISMRSTCGLSIKGGKVSPGYGCMLIQRL